MESSVVARTQMQPLPVGKGKSEDAATADETPPERCWTYDSGH
jgi:hypothetical protein